jgi:O-antigen/teichoic acid export membrane protein
MLGGRSPSASRATIAMSGISLGRVTAMLLLARAAGYALSLASSVILARSLGADRLGAYAYAMGLAGIFGLLPNLGISTIVTRTIARQPDAGTGVVVAAVRAQALLAVGLLILVPAFAALLPGQPVPLTLVGLAAAQLAVGTLSWPYLAALAGRARYDRVALAEFTAASAGTVSTLAAAALRGGVATFLWAHVLAAGLAVLAARRIAVPFLSPGGQPIVRLSALLRQAAPFGASAAIQGLYTRLDVVLLGQMAPTAALGLYSVAYKPVNLAVSLGGTVAGTLFPLMAQEPLRGVPVALARAVRGLGVAAPALALALSGLATPVLLLLFGAEYLPAAPILTMLAWSTVFNWLYGPLGISLQARGCERWWLGGLIVATAINGAGNLWAIPRWGGLGAAGATVASEAALLVVGSVLVWRKLAIVPRPRPILAGLAASMAGALVLLVLRGSGAVPATGAALIVYGGLLVLLRMITAKDVTLLTSWFRQATLGGSRTSRHDPGARAVPGEESQGLPADSDPHA